MVHNFNFLKIDEEHRMKHLITFLFIDFLPLSSACKPGPPVCPPDSIDSVTNSTGFPTSVFTPDAEAPQNPLQVEINGRTMLVDDVVRGQLREDGGVIRFLPAEIK